MGSLTGSSASARVLKALSVFGSIQVLSMLCSVVRTKMVALWTGTVGVGIWSLYVSTLELLRVGGAMSMDRPAVPEIASVQPSRQPEICHSVLHTGKVLGLWAAIVTVLLSPVLSKITFGNYSYTWGFILLAPAIFVNSLHTAWQAVLQGQSRLRALARSSMYATVAGTLFAVPALYFMRLDGIVPVIVAYPVLVLLFMMREGYEKPSAPVDPQLRRAVMRRIISGGIPITVAVMITYVADYVLRVYLNHATSIEEVGLFQSGANIIKTYVGMIFTAIAMEFFPRIASVVRKPLTTRVLVNHEINLLVAVLMPIMTVFVCCDRLVLNILYSSEFVEVAPLILAAVPSTMLRAVSWCMAVVILARTDSRIYFITELTSAVALLVFSYIGLKLWGLTGLGAAITAQYACYTLATWLVVRYRYGIKLSGRTVRTVALGIATVCVAIVLRVWVGTLAPLALLVPMGAVALRNPKAVRIAKKILRK